MAQGRKSHNFDVELIDKQLDKFVMARIKKKQQTAMWVSTITQVEVPSNPSFTITL